MFQNIKENIHEKKQKKLVSHQYHHEVMSGHQTKWSEVLKENLKRGNIRRVLEKFRKVNEGRIIMMCGRMSVSHDDIQS